MLELFSSDTAIVLGLDLSEEEDNLIRTAASLSIKTGARLVMVHALQPFRSYVSAGEDMALPYEAFEQDIYFSDRKEAEQKLISIRDRLPSDLVIETRICSDYPENALESVAAEVGASLILCGMRIHKESHWYGSMSTALTLMGESGFPVMIIPLAAYIDFTTRSHKILVADNLRDEGLCALKAALGLCKSISYEQLIHLHVKKSTYREINEVVDRIRIAMIEGRLPNDPEFEAESYLKSIKDGLRAVMERRLEIADSDFAKGLHWTPRVKFGQPIEELRALVRESRSDILVFGKHHFIRPKGFAMGKIPYQAMIDANVASIVIPDHPLPRA